jgi:hypothetical protein
MDSRMALSLARNLGRARRAGGDLAVVCLESSVCRLLELFGIKDKLQVCETVEEAAAALTQAQAQAGSDAPSPAKTNVLGDGRDSRISGSL